jgi:hypothetical protein
MPPLLSISTSWRNQMDPTYPSSERTRTPVDLGLRRVRQGETLRLQLKGQVSSDKIPGLRLAFLLSSRVRHSSQMMCGTVSVPMQGITCVGQLVRHVTQVRFPMRSGMCKVNALSNNTLEAGVFRGSRSSQISELNESTSRSGLKEHSNLPRRRIGRRWVGSMNWWPFS